MKKQKYEVMIHTTRGYRFIVEAGSKQEAEERAHREFADEGSDGLEGGYENVDEIVATEMHGAEG